MEAPRYTAKEIEDGLYSGMDPDVELVAAQYYDALTAERDELQRRLEDIAKHAAAPNWGDIVCAGGKLELATTRMDEILAIAEGRTE